MMQAKWGSHGDYQVIAVSPWSVQEMYDLTLRAFNLSERYRVPVIVLAEEAVGHLRENISIPHQVEIWSRRKEKDGSPFGTDAEDGVPPMPAFGEGARLLVTGSTHDGKGFRKTDDPEAHQKLVDRINQKILRNRKSIVEAEHYFLDDSVTAVVAYGFTARTSLFVVKRLRKEGIRAGLVRLKTLWPFPEEILKEVTKRVKKIVVPEMNQGQVAGEVKKACLCDVVSIPQTNGEVIAPDKIMNVLREMES
jgi:2-oxoglutarate ferredoxin oxidoreductase subunit alpha